MGSVLVVGVGGLGSATLPYLAASGIPRIGMIDFDQIEESNLHRQTLFGYNDIGRWKVEVAKERLSHLYPQVHFHAQRCQITPQNAQNIFVDYDLILDGTDNLEARLAINDACNILQKPWIYGSIHQWEGQVSLFLPGNPDYRSLFPEGTSEFSPVTCSSGGVLGPFVGLIGTLQASVAIKWLTDREETLAGKLLLINGQTWRSTLITLSSVPNYEISYSLLKKWMESEPIQLMDARQLTLDSLAKNQKIVVYCQMGRRSFALMRQLRKEGFDAYSLEGGIENI